MPDRVLRVLTLDDNPDDRQRVLHELKTLYPEAKAAEPTDPAEFEAALAAGRPGLVVTDLDLRWTSGRDVLAVVKGRYPGCPVIMFTGTGDETTAVELMRAGLDNYVVKSPRQLARLRASIRVITEAAASRRALTEREAQLTAALAHKDLLLREMHHRVKNNLQTISSLLQLSAKRADTAAMRAHLEELAGRMRALSQVQTRIYETEELDRVDFRAALDDIACGLHQLYGGDQAAADGGRIGLQRDFDGPLALEVSRAMPLGLLCHELILNAFKHAWPRSRPGRLVVALRARDGAVPEIGISDDGVGLDAANVRGLGSRLVQGLAAEARAEVETKTAPGGGTSVTLRLV